MRYFKSKHILVVFIVFVFLLGGFQLKLSYASTKNEKSGKNNFQGLNVYTNSFNGYSVEYPDNWYLYPAKDAGSATELFSVVLGDIHENPVGGLDQLPRLNIIAYNNSQQLGVEKWNQTFTGQQKITSFSNDGLTVYEYQGRVYDFLEMGIWQPSKVYYIAGNGRIFRIILQSNGDTSVLLENIVKSFKLTDEYLPNTQTQLAIQPLDLSDFEREQGALSQQHIDKDSPVPLQAPWSNGVAYSLTGSYYGQGYHTDSYTDYYASDWNRTGTSCDGELGDAVLAAQTGTVSYVQPNDGGVGTGGRYVRIALAANSSIYVQILHLNTVTTTQGQPINSLPYQIGTVGDSGLGTGGCSHIHLTVREIIGGNDYSIRPGNLSGQSVAANVTITSTNGSGGGSTPPPTNTSVPPSGEVKLYSQANFGGSVVYSGGTGFSNTPNADSYSLQMPNGWSVKTWRGNDKSGEERCWTSSVNNLQDHGWQTSIQSLEAFNSNVCISPTNTPSSGEVKLYSQANFGGNTLYSGGTGFSNNPNADSYSLQMPSGWSVKTWRGNDRSGEERCWSSSVNNLQDHGWHLAIQSIEAFNYNNCPAPATVVTLCTNDSGNSGCDQYGLGEYDLSGSPKNDTYRSVLVPSGWSIFIFKDDHQRNTAECYSGDRKPLPSGEPWDLAGQVTSFEVFNQSNCPDSMLSSVILYTSINYQAHHWGMGYDEGVWNVPSLRNDEAELVRIPNNLSVILYDYANAGGEASGCLTGVVGNLDSLNNRVSSVRIYPNTTCTVPDANAPTGQVTAPLGDDYNWLVMPIEVSASDVGSGVESVDFYAWSTAAWSNQEWIYLGTDTTSPYSLNWDISALPEDFQYVSANIWDNAGNESGLLWGDTQWGWFLIDRTLPSSAVAPLSATSSSQFTVNWSGFDTRTPFGDLRYDVEYQTGCTGSWILWQNQTSLLNANFTGIVGNSYCFRSRAYDNAGNIEAYPGSPDATTTIINVTNTPIVPTQTWTPVGSTSTPSVPLPPAPALVSPSHRTHTTNRQPTFTWMPVANAQSYRIMIYNADRSFEFKKRVFPTTYTMETPLTPQTYQWRVRTQDINSGVWSLWSKRYTLFID